MPLVKMAVVLRGAWNRYSTRIEPIASYRYLPGSSDQLRIREIPREIRPGLAVPNRHTWNFLRYMVHRSIDSVRVGETTSDRCHPALGSFRFRWIECLLSARLGRSEKCCGFRRPENKSVSTSCVRGAVAVYAKIWIDVPACSTQK